MHRFSPLDGLSPLGGPQNTASRIDQAQLRSDTTGRQPVTGPVWRLWAFGTSRERRTSRPRLTPLHLIHSLTLRARSLRGALKLAVLTGIDLNSANAECGLADAMWLVVGIFRVAYGSITLDFLLRDVVESSPRVNMHTKKLGV